jgi:leucyl aminopeptidase
MMEESMDRHSLAAALLMASTSAMAAQNSWLTVGETAYLQLKQDGYRVTIRANRASRAADQGTTENIYLLEVASKEVPKIAGALHRKLRHCGGFMYHASEADALRVLDEGTAPANASRPAYRIANQATVVPLLAQMEEARIGATIGQLSAFVNRYYTSTHGIEASNWLRRHWAELAGAHAGITVAQYAHAGYGQQSVIATIAGSDRAAEVIVLGAHLDSINTGSSREGAVAPGADDDASGVAGLTEVLRVLAASGYRPRRTIKFIAYAAEEVGLRGSQDIARDFRKNKVDVVGVLQLDMTNYKGSGKDIYLISDYTDAQQNQFLGKLVESYLPTLTVGADRCGYACSDHAAWTAQGFATSMPFESMLGQDNPAIHTKNDTWAGSGSQAAHALKFTRMAGAFAVELGSESQ